LANTLTTVVVGLQFEKMTKRIALLVQGGNLVEHPSPVGHHFDDLAAVFGPFVALFVLEVENKCNSSFLIITKRRRLYGIVSKSP